MLSAERPVVSDLKRPGLDIALELFAFVLLTAIWGTTIYQYPQLPRSIPRRFDASGVPNAWGSKSTALVLPIISLVLYASLTVLNRFPHRFNYPWPITKSNARSQYVLARQLLTAIKASVGCIFTYMNWATIETALATRHGLGAWFLPTAVSLSRYYCRVFLSRAPHGGFGANNRENGAVSLVGCVRWFERTATGTLSIVVAWSRFAISKDPLNACLLQGNTSITRRSLPRSVAVFIHDVWGRRFMNGALGFAYRSFEVGYVATETSTSCAPAYLVSPVRRRSG